MTDDDEHYVLRHSPPSLVVNLSARGRYFFREPSAAEDNEPTGARSDPIGCRATNARRHFRRKIGYWRRSQFYTGLAEGVSVFSVSGAV
jgi:hypothetical protein